MGKIYSVPFFSFLHETLFWNTVCARAVWFSYDKPGREKGRDEAQRLNGSARTQQLVKAVMCSTGEKRHQAQHKARVAKPEWWLQRSGIQGLTLFPERQAITTWKTCNKSSTRFSWNSLFGFWQMNWCPSGWTCMRKRTETLQRQLGPRSWSCRTAGGREGASGKNWGN